MPVLLADRVTLAVRTDIGWSPFRETLHMHVLSVLKKYIFGTVSTHADSTILVVNVLNADAHWWLQAKRLHIKLVELCKCSHVSYLKINVKSV